MATRVDTGVATATTRSDPATPQKEGKVVKTVLFVCTLNLMAFNYCDNQLLSMIFLPVNKVKYVKWLKL